MYKLYQHRLITLWQFRYMLIKTSTSHAPTLDWLWHERKRSSVGLKKAVNAHCDIDADLLAQIMNENEVLTDVRRILKG